MAPRPPASVKREVVRFALLCILALVVVGIASYRLALRVSHGEAIEDAADQATRLATTSVAPLVYADEDSPGYDAGLEKLDAMVVPRIEDGLLLRVKVWKADGTIIYSDEPRLINRRFALDEEDAEVLREGGATAELTQLEADENVFDNGLGEHVDAVVEVYAAFESVDGVPLLFEAYLPERDLVDKRNELLVALLPTMVAGPGLLAFLIAPLVISLTRRLRNADRARMQSLQRSLDAVSKERRRLAKDLHDLVIPELAGVKLVLESMSEGAPGPQTRVETGLLSELATVVRRQLGILRGEITTLSTPSVARMSLEEAVRELGRPLQARGIDLLVNVQETGLNADARRFAVTVVREGLRNVARHSTGTRAVVTIRMEKDQLLAEVADDGRAELPESAMRSERGLGLLADTVAELGGQTQLRQARPHGVVLSVQVPLAIFANDHSPADGGAPRGAVETPQRSAAVDAEGGTPFADGTPAETPKPPL